MIQAGVAVGAGIAACAFFLFFVLDTDIAGRKVRQKVERAARDLALSASAIRQWSADRGSPPVPEEGALPAGFAAWFAEVRGGAPLHQELGRLSRLDLLSPGEPYSRPFGYMAEGPHWVLLSRGPDLDLDIDAAAWAECLATATSQPLAVLSYDPTNGANSGGDCWIAGGFPDAP